SRPRSTRRASRRSARRRAVFEHGFTDHGAAPADRAVIVPRDRVDVVRESRWSGGGRRGGSRGETRPEAGWERGGHRRSNLAECVTAIVNSSTSQAVEKPRITEPIAGSARDPKGDRCLKLAVIPRSSLATRKLTPARSLRPW